VIEQLLPYYEKQLQEFGQQSREFSQKYPKIAQRLSLNQEQIDDPHIERLIQAFSLNSARVDKKLGARRCPVLPGGFVASGKGWKGGGPGFCILYLR